MCLSGTAAEYSLRKDETFMIYTAEVQHMCPVAKGAYHGPAPIPEEGKWVQAKEIKDISGFTHGVGWCAPQQGACKLSLNIKDGVIEEACAPDQFFPPPLSGSVWYCKPLKTAGLPMEDHLCP